MVLNDGFWAVHLNKISTQIFMMVKILLKVRGLRSNFRNAETLCVTQQ
jgi:hypothetical protein